MFSTDLSGMSYILGYGLKLQVSESFQIDAS